MHRNGYSAPMSKKRSVDEEQGLLSSLGADDLMESAKDSFYTMTSGISDLNDSLSNHMSDITSSLPAVEVGPFSAEYRGRLLTSLYLIIASAFFLGVAIFVGLPTLVIRPTKFVLCMTLATLLTIASVMNLQKPTVFIASLCSGDPWQKIPFLALLTSVLVTGYVTVFIHTYFSVVLCGGIQCLAILFFLASYIPGGQTGLIMVLRASVVVVRTALTPALFCAKQTAQLALRRFNSS